MAVNIAWASTVINSRAIATQDFSLWLSFLKGTDIASYLDDTTPYNPNLTQEVIINGFVFFK